MASADAAEPVQGLYLGGSLGMARTDGSVNRQNVAKIDETDLAMSLRAGYRFHTHWAVEGGYADLGKSKYRLSGGPDHTVNSRVWHLDGVGILPLVDKLAAFGKIGVARVQYDDGGYWVHRTVPHLGIGVSYAFTSALELRAEYDNYGKASLTRGSYSGELHSDQFSLGMDYRF